MHVLVLPSWFPTDFSAAGAYFYEQLNALQDAGCTVGVVYPEHHSLRRLTTAALATHRFQTRWHVEHGIPVLRRHSWNVRSRLNGTFAARIRDAEQLAQRYAAAYGVPDIVHAMSAQWAGPAAARIASIWNRPMALTEHFSGFMRNTLLPEQRARLPKAFSHAHAVAAVSPTLRDTLIRQEWCTAPIRLIPNPVDCSFFTRPARRPTAPPLRLATVGRLVPEKGIDLLLHAFRRVVLEQMGLRDANVALHIAGTGPEHETLRTLASDLDIDQYVTFHGHLSRAAVRDLLHRSHLFVLPSRHETFGIAVAEAVATGCPVLATRCGGPEHILTPSTGHLVASHSVPALATGLRTMVPTLHQYDTAVLRDSACNRFGVVTFTERTMALYREALASFS